MKVIDAIKELDSLQKEGYGGCNLAFYERGEYGFHFLYVDYIRKELFFRDFSEDIEDETTFRTICLRAHRNETCDFTVDDVIKELHEFCKAGMGSELLLIAGTKGCIYNSLNYKYILGYEEFAGFEPIRIEDKNIILIIH